MEETRNESMEENRKESMEETRKKLERNCEKNGKDGECSHFLASFS